ncbi:MAG TPA: glycosyltransferase family 2 protein [Anaerolineales bacterium]|nr:glycosyltransferase family 2 protein [Anaerolineales bacterium]
MDLSIVVPVYNEEESLPHLHKAFEDAFNQAEYSWEVIYVNDGSADGSLQILEMLAAQDPEHVRAVALRRNFGQTAAIAAGIDHSIGDVIVLIDADLQNDPSDIPMMMEKIDQGYDVVSGWRIKRQDTFFTRKLPSQLANGLISRVTGVHLHDYGCTLKAYRREVLTGFRLYGEMHRFIPAYASTVGARMIELPVKHHARKYGHTKYGLTRTVKVILDLFTVKFLMSYANKPIYLFGGAGLTIILVSTIMLIGLIIRRIFWGVEVLSSPFFVMSIMFAIMGFQSILMGLIAELQVRTYHESQHKPTYTLLKYLPGNQKTSPIPGDLDQIKSPVELVPDSQTEIAGISG